MPIGPPFHVPEPKSALSPALDPMLETHAADCGCTGSAETSACQNEFGGVMGHAGAPGTGVPCASPARSNATGTRSDMPARRRGEIIVGP